MSTAPPVVEFKGVSKTFNPGTAAQFTALKDITFRIEDKPNYGEFVAILGPSGCGKSTILNLIHGFSDVYPPTTGEVLVRGGRVAGPGRDRGMIFQRYSSFPHRTVLQNACFGLELNRDVIRPAPELSSSAVNTSFIMGIGAVAERMLILIDIEGLMSSADMGLMDAMTTA